MHQRLFAVDAGGFFLARRIEQQDGVLGHQAHQHDHADQAHQVQGAAGQQQGQHDADQAERQRHHHAQRRGEAVELDHEHKVHQRDARQQRGDHGREHHLLVARGAGQLDAKARREFDLLGQLLGLGRDLARRAALGVGADRDRALAVAVLNLARALAHRDIGDLVQRHHAVGAGHRDRQSFDVGRIHSVAGMQPDGDVPRFAGRVDPVAGLDARERHAQGLRSIVHRDAHLVGQPAVELNLQFVLRVLLGVADVDRALDAGHGLLEVLRDLLELAGVGAVEADLHRLLRAVVQVIQHHILGAHQAADLLAQLLGDVGGGALALGALANVHIDAAAAGVGIGGRGLGLGHGRGQGRRGVELELGIVQAAGGRAAHLDGQEAGIGLRQEAGAAELGLQGDRPDEAGHREGRHPATVVQRPGDHVAVAIRDAVEPVVEALEPLADAALGLFVVARWVAPIGRQHRVEGEADQQ
mmetsp:Transcript_15038/g.35548  ORF Transcript_15038/g.35548 Transcript_15038/m.35548 type:complete len:471 (-) Transcript_15038:1551-2963(-)